MKSSKLVCQLQDCQRLVEEHNLMAEKAQAKANILDAKKTTVGQLNFFKWAIINDVLAYASRHRLKIEKHMAGREDEAVDCSATAGGLREYDDTPPPLPLLLLLLSLVTVQHASKLTCT